LHEEWKMLEVLSLVKLFCLSLSFLPALPDISYSLFMICRKHYRFMNS
jgi:hypothetical protein